MQVSVQITNVFMQLTVVKREESIKGRAMWLCRCDCGALESFSSKQLTTGIRTACIDCQDSGSKSPLHIRLRKYEVAEDGCWNWKGKVNEFGYGAVTVEGRHTRAHRAMFFLLNPKADRSLVVMHMCDNPPCINPDHLRLGTHSENIQDMHNKGRHKNSPKQNKLGG